jgi:hypothetical protein
MQIVDWWNWLVYGVVVAFEWLQRVLKPFMWLIWFCIFVALVAILFALSTR